MAVNIANTGKRSLDIDFGRPPLGEIRARHHARERLARTVAGDEVEQREPVLDEWNAKQGNAGLKTMRDSIASKNIVDHFAVGFDVPNHDRNLVRTFTAYQ